MLNVDLLYECTEAGQMNSAKSTFIICVGSEKKTLGVVPKTVKRLSQLLISSGL